MTLRLGIGFALALLIGIGYIVWMSTGCNGLDGVMTWGGKVCVK